MSKNFSKSEEKILLNDSQIDNLRNHQKASFSERLADQVASAIGSWKFLITQTIIVLIWLGLNLYGAWRHWDPYPFILLNLIFSIQAAYTAPILLMAQNREAQRDRLRADADLKTDVIARHMIERLASKIDRLEKAKIDKILRRLPDPAHKNNHK